MKFGIITHEEDGSVFGIGMTISSATLALSTFSQWHKHSMSLFSIPIRIGSNEHYGISVVILGFGLEISLFLRPL